MPVTNPTHPILLDFGILITIVSYNNYKEETQKR
jgi:hypothetical protein